MKEDTYIEDTIEETIEQTLEEGLAEVAVPVPEIAGEDASERSTGASVLYAMVVAGVFGILAVVFLFFPRSTYSELEKRDLAQCPAFTADDLWSNRYTAALSSWFSDSEPYRDDFMAVNMQVRDAIRYSFGGEEAISYHAPSAEPGAVTDPNIPSETPGVLDEEAESFGVNEKAKVGHKGIVVVGEGPTVRALMAYGGKGGGDAHVKMAQRYAAELPGVRIYSAPIPLASEFYMPEKAKNISNSQRSTVENIRNTLGPTVKFVDAYSALARHRDEDIYLRTDHHWAPLGAFYAAKEIAAAAGVPFRDLGAYDKKVIHGFVGSMYGYSQDIAIKNAPEDFVYYVPNAVSYATTFRTYSLNSDYKVTSESKPYQSTFFKHFKDGTSAAYSTFMGGDQHLVQISTGTKNGRKLMIIKDSYGNAVPGYMFYSFEEVHVVDFRYFTHNMRSYVAANGITDIVFVFNMFNTYSSSVAKRLERYLTQNEGEYAAPTPKASADTTHTPAKKSAEPAEETEVKAEETPAAAPEAVEEPKAAPEPVVEPEAPAQDPGSERNL